MKFLIWGVLGLVIIALDLIFIPGGLLIIVGSCFLVYSVYLNYAAHGAWAALIEIIVILSILPFLIRYGLSRLALKSEMRAEDGFVAVEDFSIHIGKEGKAMTDLRPSGTVLVPGETGEMRLDCIAEGGYIEAGEQVKVVGSNGPSITVRRIG